MNKSDDEETARFAGQLVNFVSLDVSISLNKDFRFQARCHFIPRIEERVEYRSRVFQVTRVYHRTVDMSGFDKYPAVVANVVCRFIGESKGDDGKVRALLESLQ